MPHGFPMKEQIPAIQSEALALIANAADERSLEDVRIAVLGKKGTLTLAAAGMKDVPKEDKAEVGQILNAARTAITAALEEKQASLQELADLAALTGIDVTLPSRVVATGALHPLTLIRNEAIGILRRMGFALADGPEIEDEFHCFDALNTPADHPARNEKDLVDVPEQARKELEFVYAAHMDEVLKAALEENPVGRKVPPSAEPEGDKKPPKKAEEVRV